jgi:hypothetical protein
METFLIALAGIIGTTGMVLLMSLIHRMRWANADMVRAIGSVYTRSKELSFLPGLVLHYTAGITFAFAYALLVGVSPASTPGAIFGICLATGAVHGIVVSLLLTVIVAEHHPVREFRRAGLGVALAHVVGHLAYGLCIGLSFIFSRVQFSFRADLLEGRTMETLVDFMNFAGIWVILFGIPIAFASYVLYMAFTARVQSMARAEELRPSRRKLSDGGRRRAA